MKRIITLILIALALVACGDSSDQELKRQQDEDYCNTTYVSTWDGRQVKPLSCPE